MSANRLHRIRWRWVVVARIDGTAASQFPRDLVNTQQSIVKEGWKLSANGLHRIRWRRFAMARIHWTGTSQFARDFVHIQHSIVEKGVENVGKQTPLDPMEMGCRGKSSSVCCISVCKRLSKDTGKYSCRGNGKCWQTDSIGCNFTSKG